MPLMPFSAVPASAQHAVMRAEARGDDRVRQGAHS